MNDQFAQYTPYQGGLMQSFQGGQQGFDPAMMNDSNLQKLLQAQVQQQLFSSFAPQDPAQQNAMQQMLSSGGAGKGGAAPVAPNTTALPQTPVGASGGSGNSKGGNVAPDGTPNPHLSGMWQADRYI
jgi:hypothetical protein